MRRADNGFRHFPAPAARRGAHTKSPRSGNTAASPRAMARRGAFGQKPRSDKIAAASPYLLPARQQGAARGQYCRPSPARARESPRAQQSLPQRHSPREAFRLGDMSAAAETAPRKTVRTAIGRRSGKSTQQCVSTAVTQHGNKSAQRQLSAATTQRSNESASSKPAQRQASAAASSAQRILIPRRLCRVPQLCPPRRIRARHSPRRR